MIKRFKKFFYRALILGGILILCIYSLSWYIKSSTKDQIFNDIDKTPEVHTVIILGASVYSSGRLSTILEDRVASALELYKKGKVKRFLLSGDNGKKTYNEPEAMKAYLIARGVPEDHIFLDYAGFDTYDSMYRASAVFNVKDAIVVTQEFHLPRAIYISNKLDLNFQGFEGDKHIYQSATMNKTRELLANVKAILELTFGKEPTYLGSKIPIDGPPQSTYTE